MIMACNIAKQHNLNNITIVSDSRYVINSVELWLPKWLDNEFKTYKNKSVVNKKLMLDLLEAKSDLSVNWVFTRGHNEDFGNTKADDLAKSALIGDSHKLGAVLTFSENQQLKDPAIERVHVALVNPEEGNNSRYDNFIIKNGLVYHKQTTDDGIEITRLLVPNEQRLTPSHSPRRSAVGRPPWRSEDAQKAQLVLVARNG